MPRYERLTHVQGGRSRFRTVYRKLWPFSQMYRKHAHYKPAHEHELSDVHRYHSCGHLCMGPHGSRNGSFRSHYFQEGLQWGCCRCREVERVFRVPIKRAWPPPWTKYPRTEDVLARPQKTIAGFTSVMTRERYGWTNVPKDYGLASQDARVKFAMTAGMLDAIEEVELHKPDAPTPLSEKDLSWASVTADHTRKTFWDTARYQKERIPFAPAQHLGWHAGLRRPALKQPGYWARGRPSYRYLLDLLGVINGATPAKFNLMCPFCKAVSRTLPMSLFWEARGYSTEAAQYMTRREEAQRIQMKKEWGYKAATVPPYSVYTGADTPNYLPQFCNANLDIFLGAQP